MNRVKLSYEACECYNVPAPADVLMHAFPDLPHTALMPDLLQIRFSLLRVHSQWTRAEICAIVPHHVMRKLLEQSIGVSPRTAKDLIHRWHHPPGLPPKPDRVPTTDISTKCLNLLR